MAVWQPRAGTTLLMPSGPEGDHLFIVLNDPAYEEVEIVPHQVSIFLGDNYVISFHDHKQDIFKQRYQGSRYSFGYPACPRLEDQLKLWPLLRPERITVTLTEEFQLEPEQTTTALIVHHRQAKYFNVR